MSHLYTVLTLLALSGLGLAVVLELHRSRREERQWQKVRNRLAQEVS